MNQPTLIPATEEAPTTRGPQRWHCDLCKLTYTSPLPLSRPPNHNCHPPGGPMRNRKMVLGETG